MDPMETLVRETFSDRAEDAPGAGGLLDAVRAADTSAGRHRWWYAGLAAAVVAAIAVGMVTVGQGSNERPTAPHGGPVITPPPGYKLASYRGITVAVPKRLPIVGFTCVPPSNEVIALDDIAPSCPGFPPSRHRPPVGTVIALAPSSYDSEYRKLATTPVSIDGQHALRGYGSLRTGLDPPGRSGAVVLPSLHLIVGVSAPTRREIDAVLDSIRITPVDANGCRARVSSLQPAGNSPAQRLVPGRPVSAVACQYESVAAKDGGRALIGSYAIDARWTQRLAALINKFPLRTVGSSGIATGPPAYLLTFRYADGATRQISAAVVPERIGEVLTDGRLKATAPDFAVADLLEHVR